MSKNLIPEIAHMLGVEIGEEFKIETFDYVTYRFDNDGLKATLDKKPEAKQETANAELCGLLSGLYVKLPWKPKEGESYWTFILYDCDIRLGIEPRQWTNDIFDFALFKAGWVYRTYEEAATALPALAEEIGVSYAP